MADLPRLLEEVADRALKKYIFSTSDKLIIAMSSVGSEAASTWALAMDRFRIKSRIMRPPAERGDGSRLFHWTGNGEESDTPHVIEAIRRELSLDGVSFVQVTNDRHFLDVDTKCGVHMTGTTDIAVVPTDHQEPTSNFLLGCIELKTRLKESDRIQAQKQLVAARCLGQHHRSDPFVALTDCQQWWFLSIVVDELVACGPYWHPSGLVELKKRIEYAQNPPRDDEDGDDLDRQSEGGADTDNGSDDDEKVLPPTAFHRGTHPHLKGAGDTQQDSMLVIAF